MLYIQYITSMTDAAKDYFTTDNVPAKVGQSSKITLGEMLARKLLLPIGGNATCDLEKSYTEVTKMDKDYQLRVELSCEDYSDYIVITLGCKDFCNLVCTQQTTTKPSTTTPTQQSTKKYTVTFDSNGGSLVSSQTVVSGKKATKPTDPTKENFTFVEWTLNGETYNFDSAVTSNITLVASWKENVKYQYSKPITTNTTDSVWSDWSKTQRVWEKNKTFTNTSLKEYKVVSTGTAFNGNYNCNNTVDSKDAEVVKDNAYKNFNTTPNSYYTEWEVIESEYVSSVPLKTYNTTDSSVATEKYEFVKTQVKALCTGCAQTMQYVYKYSTRELVEETIKSCPKGYTETADGTKCYKEVENYSCDKYGSDYKLDSNNKCVKTIENCTKKLEDYTDYQYRTLEEKVSSNTSYDYKWSYSNNDAELLKDGYTLTGKTE